jgi:hypothetical protein
MSNRNSRKSGKNRREQSAKGREYARSMQELRRSSATSPIPSGTKYKRAKAGARGKDW